MPKLNQNEQIKVNKKILNGILNHYGLSLQDYSIAKHGIENTTVLLRTNDGDRMLRVYRRNKKPVSHIENELAFMDYLRKHKLPVPRIYTDTKGKTIVIYRDRGLRWYCFLMEVMPGIHSKSYTKELLKDMAEKQARMHILGVKFAKEHDHAPILSRTLRVNEFAKKIDINKITKPEVIQVLNRIKKFKVNLDASLPRGFNHIDYDNENSLSVKNKVTAILDFDDAHYCPVAVCLANTLFDILFETRKTDNLRLYLTYYSKLRRLTKLERDSLRELMMHRNYVIGSMELMFWGQNGKFVKTLLRLEEVLKNLNIIL